MIFATPQISEIERAVIQEIEQTKKRLRVHMTSPRRWFGLLRRSTFAKNIRASNAIEGHNISVDDAIAAAEDEEPLDASTPDWRAVMGYRTAMTYVIQLASDPTFRYSPGLIKSLHYMMMQHDLDKDPGRWRPGGVHVYSTRDDEIVYEGPDAGLVPDLVDELVAYLAADDGIHDMVKAAMAHLNLAMIHPFRDGNGRMARCLQTLVLARNGELSPDFSSIEEYLGKNTDGYYNVLSEVGQGAWHPENHAGPWVRFCLTAHYRQAMTLLRRINKYEVLWEKLWRLVQKNGYHNRTILALADSAMGFRVRNGTYRKAAEISQQVASRDLKTLTDSAILIAKGESRGRYYLPGEQIKQISEECSKLESKKIDDPFDVLEERKQLSLLEKIG